MQLLFIRKEIEKRTVQDSELLKKAVQVAINNCFGKRKARLWKRKRRVYDEMQVPVAEIEAIRERMKKSVPWTPWQKRGGGERG